MRFLSDDGKVFNTQKECADYESKLREKELREQKLRAEKGSRYASIKKHNDELMEEIRRFEEDYGTKVFVGRCSTGLEPFLEELLRGK